MKNEPKLYNLSKACEQNLSKLKDKTDRVNLFHHGWSTTHKTPRL